ncbi:FMN-binding negative transcriptional regulator [Streptomyces sp. NPDC004539]|uniref:FMN-binding negative transcriptional regulator n=1 Tax=Streptomyces sp. NPDC004539 TaxID=3154280 RepID=UPI0033A7CE04
MLIHPWDTARDDAEWQQWLTTHDFGQLAVNGLAGEPPWVQPTHFLYDPEQAEILIHLARPNPIWRALEADPHVVLSVADDYAFIPGPWQAEPGVPAEHGTPTTYYAAVQLHCTAHVIDDPAAKSALLARQMAHFQPEGGSVPTDSAPFDRMLPGLRGLRLDISSVRAKFKYGGKRSAEVRERVADRLTARGGPGDARVREHVVRRSG